NTDIIHLQVFGFHLLICNSQGVADDLLDKWLSIYSNRPCLPMMVELMGFSWSLSFMPYNEWWKNSCRLFHKCFQPSAVPQFCPKKIRAAHRHLQKLLDTQSTSVSTCNCTMASSTILNIAYRLDIHTLDNPYLKWAEECLKIIEQAGNPGLSLLISFPHILKYVPEWMPGVV
ncbi:hypothetical protein EI94DRAFT_1603497, partial [Lactarius quietus]